MSDPTRGQFPALDDDPQAEVAQRTEADTDGDWYRKVFTVHNRAHTRGLPLDHQTHRDNFAAVLQSALQQGLHPKDVPELESEEPHPTDPDRHTNLSYRVRVVPAVSDLDPGSTVTPSALGHLLREDDAAEPAEDPATDPAPRKTPATGKTAGKATGG